MIVWLCWAAGMWAQQADSVRTFTQERPLVYEDAWDLWPYVFLNEDGEAVGYNVDLLKMIFQELHIPYVIRLKPTQVALEDLKAGRSDLMCGMAARFHNEYAQYSESVIQIFTHSVAHQKGKECFVNELTDLSSHRVIVHKNSFSHHLMKEKGWGGNAIAYDDMREAVQRVHNNAESQIVWNTMSLKWLIQTLHYDNMKLTPVQIPPGEYKFMSNNVQLLQQMDSVYAKLNSSGQLQAIQNKWFYPERVDSGIPDWIWQVAAGMLLLTLISVTYYVIYRRQERRMTSEVRRSNSRLALILRTSRVRTWILHVQTRMVNPYDENGQEVVEEQPLRNFLQFVAPGDFRPLIGALNAIMAQQTDQQTLDIHARDERGGYRRNLSIGLAALQRDKNGRPTEILGTTSDVTEEHVRQLQVKDSMLRYRSIFENAMIDCVTYDENGYLTDMNETACRAFPGGKAAAIAQRINLTDILGDDLPPLDELQVMHLTRVYKAQSDARVFNKELHDDTMYYELQLVPVRNAEGQLLMIFGTGRDVTEHVHSYKKLRQNTEQMEQANEEMNNYIGNIDYVLKNGGVRVVKYSPRQQVLTIYSRIDQVQNELTQLRALALTDVESRQQCQELFSSMDSLTPSAFTASVKTKLHTKEGLPLSLYLSFVPTQDASGLVTEYFGMCRDISEIKAAEDLLAIETRKALEVETVKSAFLRNMSYEIRTPLSSVVGFAELFAMEHAIEDEPFFIEEIKNNSAQLLHLINDILFLSRLDAHMIEFKPRDVDFVAFFEPRCLAAWGNVPEASVPLEVEKSTKPLVVHIDDYNVGIVIDQLLTSAAAHLTKGSLRASCDYTGGELVMAFQDTGRAVSEEFLKQQFQRFGADRNQGTGLGLSICQELTQQMGGTIRITSEPDEGITVWILLPCEEVKEEVKSEK